MYISLLTIPAVFALRGVKPGLFARALRALALRAVQRRASYSDFLEKVILPRNLYKEFDLKTELMCMKGACDMTRFQDENLVHLPVS